MRRDLIALSENSKVWIYQASKPIDYETAAEIKSALYNFSMNWLSHGQVVEAYANLFHHRFIVLVADESNHPGGCSIDSSVHFIKEIGSNYKLDFFNRMNFAYLDGTEIKSLDSESFRQAYQQKQINDDTLVFDNLVNTKQQFLSNWVLPLKDSWHNRFIH